MVDIVEKASDVSVQNPVHFLRLDAHVECVQGPVTVSSRTKTVTETQEVLFVDAFEHDPHGLLDNLILQCCDPEGPQLAVELGYPNSFRRLCSIRSPMNPRMPIDDPRLEVFGVLGPTSKN